MNIFERIQQAAKCENREEVKRLTALLGVEDRETPDTPDTPDTPEETEGQEEQDTPQDTPDTPEEEEGEGVPEETEQEPQDTPQETEGETEDTETPEGQEEPQEGQEETEQETEQETEGETEQEQEGPQEEDRQEPQEQEPQEPQEQDIPEDKPEPQDFDDREQEGEEPQDIAPEPQEREEETEQEQEQEQEQEETTTTTTPETPEEVTESVSVSGCRDIHPGIGYEYWPLAEEHKRDLQAGAREVLEIDPGIDEILEEVAEDIAETWDLLKAPSRSSRIGSAQGRLGIGSLRRVATAHPLPFHGPAIKQGFDNTEVIVLLDRSGSMWQRESLTLSNGRKVYGDKIKSTGSRWSVACLTIAAMQRAIELVGRTDEINLRVISWANDCQSVWCWADKHHTNVKKGRPVTMNHGGGVSRLTAVNYRDVADVRVRKKGTGFKGKAIFIEHEPSAMACAALNLTGSRMDSYHHAGGSNDILPTMTSLMSILGPEDPGCRRLGILFSDGDIGFSKCGPGLPYHSNPLKPLPGIGRSQFQLMLDQWDSEGIPVGVVDYGAGLAMGISNPEQVAIGADIGNMVNMMESMLR